MEVSHTQGSTKEVLLHSMVQNRHVEGRPQHKDNRLEKLLKKLEAIQAEMFAAMEDVEEIRKGFQAMILERDSHP